MKIVVYDPSTGEIQGCYTFSDSTQAVLYEHRLEVGKDISEEEFESRPEVNKKVDVQARRLVPKRSPQLDR